MYLSHAFLSVAIDANAALSLSCLVALWWSLKGAGAAAVVWKGSLNSNTNEEVGSKAQSEGRCRCSQGRASDPTPLQCVSDGYGVSLFLWSMNNEIVRDSNTRQRGTKQKTRTRTKHAKYPRP